MNCKGCGFPMMPVLNRRRGWQAVCARCGAAEAVEPVEGLSLEAAQSAGRGWNCYRLQDFDEAMAYLSDAAEQSGGLPEYLWAELLAKYGVKYCETGGGEYAVNFWRRELPEAPLSEQAEYRRLRREAVDDMEDLRSYAAAAEDIDRGLRQIRETQGERCDVFISFKDRDADGPTPERALCDGLYNELTDRGLKAFYSPRTLYGKFTTDYEGYIHSALKNARVLLIVTSCRENVCSPWVASEWRRFQLWNAGEDYRLMTCMVGSMKPSDFPPELSRYQHELRAELDQLRQMPTVKWIGGEVEKRCGIVREREPARASAEAEPAETKAEAPRPERPKPAAAKPAPEGPVEKKPAEAKPIAPKPEPAPESLEALAKGGDADAQCELGKRYSSGDGVRRNRATAAKWYRLAAEQGHAEAQRRLGECYRDEEGLAKNCEEAAKWFRLAADQGHAGAQSDLGWCYKNGRGVFQNSAEAVKWYRKAAEQGHAEAQRRLGDCYHRGEGAARDEAEAAKWYRLAAEQGDAEALCGLGRCYDHGLGVAEDKAEAMKWYRRAAERGIAEAQCRLGECYIYGLGVAEDKAEALKWYRLAAKQGSAEAQYRLGNCYARGMGVAKDPAEAMKWYRRAAERGDPYAKAEVEKLEGAAKSPDR